MKTYTISVSDDQEYQRLLEVARQAGIQVLEEGLAARPLPDISKLTAEEKLAILHRGGSGKSIPDPLGWQRTEREDRPLPFRT